MALKFTQEGRFISVKTPLGKDELLLRSMRGREAVSEPFAYELELQSEDPNIKLADIVGQDIGVTLNLPGGETREFNGIARSFRYIDTAGYLSNYRLVMVPRLWLLTRSADCRIFQEKTVPDILMEVYGEYGLKVEQRLAENYRTWDYCVQYRESDFNFVSRLMEQEGVYYFFEHRDGQDHLVLCDSTSNHDPIQGHEEILFRAQGVSGTKALKEGFQQPGMWGWQVRQEVRSGTYAHTDYDFTKPATDLATDSSVKRKHAHADLEVYDYPGEYAENGDGEQYAKVRIEELAAGHEICTGSSDARGAAAGKTFKLTDHPRDDQNRAYFVTATEISLDAGRFDQAETAPERTGRQFSAELTMVPDAPYRAPRRARKPVVEGPQTAVVTGPRGEEIHCDEYGRIKVQFHWDRVGKKDQNTTCWVRVSQTHAGGGWGAMHLPRIEEEVVVSFLEGDPDQPLVTGRVYNADKMPAYALPDNKTRSGYQSRSSPGGGAGNFNELTFEDKAGQEQVYMHAERNMDTVIEVDETREVGNDRTKTIGHDETTEVGNDRTEEVGNNEKITIGNNREESVRVNEDIDIGVNRTTKVGVNEELTVGASRKKTVGAGETNMIMAKRDTTVVGPDTETVAGPKTCTVAGPYNITAAGGFNVIAPGGTHIVDLELFRTGGFEGDIYNGQLSIVNVGKVDISPGINMAHSGIKMEHTSFKMERVEFEMVNEALCLKQAMSEMKSAAVAVYQGFKTFL